MREEKGEAAAVLENAEKRLRLAPARRTGTLAPRDTLSLYGSTPTRLDRRPCPKSAAGDAGHTSEAVLSAIVETSRAFPLCVV